MKIACLGGGPAGLYFAISMKLREPAHDITVFERNRPDDTFGWGVVFSDETFDNIAANDPPSANDDPQPFRLLGRHRGLLSRRARRIGRPRLFRHRAQEAAHAAAAASARTRREFAFPDRNRQRRGACQDPRSRGRGGRIEFKDAQRIRRVFQARHRNAQEQVRLARHAAEIRRRLHLHLRRDRARLDLGARLPVRRRHGDLHRRVLADDLGEIRLRRDEPGRILPHLRAHFCQISRRSSFDVERGAHARLGLAEFSPRAVREDGRTKTSC